MRRSIGISLALLTALSGTVAFSAKHEAPLTPSEHEAKVFDKIKKQKTTLRARIMGANEAVLMRETAKLTLFDGETAEFSLSRNEEGVWKGKSKGRSSDRFSLRPVVSGGYTGYVIHKGKRFAVTPLGTGASALYEQAQVECPLAKPVED
jgi:hypothetical protein